MSKKADKILRFNPKDLAEDKELLDCISLVTAVFLSAKRRPAVRGAFFAILKSTAALLMAEDKQFPIALTLLDRDAVRDGVGKPVPVKQVAVKKKVRARGK